MLRRRTFRVLGLCESSPALVMRNRIADGLFDEALDVARIHGVDPDPVYQAQWTQSQVSPRIATRQRPMIGDRRVDAAPRPHS